MVAVENDFCKNCPDINSNGSVFEKDGVKYEIYCQPDPAKFDPDKHSGVDELMERIANTRGFLVQTDFCFRCSRSFKVIRQH
jgi:hypothetical protein